MTPEELAHLKEAHAAATPGPWCFNTFGHHAEIVDDQNDLVLEMGSANTMDAQEHLDGYLVVEARNALPALLAEIERLQARERILAARLARVNQLNPSVYQAALAVGKGVGCGS